MYRHFMAALFVFMLFAAVQISAQPKPPKPNQGEGAIVPQVTVPFDFGTVELGKTKTFTITIKNEAPDNRTNLAINSITGSSSDISASSDKMNLKHGATATITITVKGSAKGDFNGTVNISANVKDNLYKLGIKGKVI